MYGTKDWSTIRDRAGSLHIVPNNDAFEHPRKWDCACRPAFEFISDGGYSWAIVFTHEALDGRLE